MLPQPLLELIRCSPKVTIISDHAKCASFPQCNKQSNVSENDDDPLEKSTSLHSRPTQQFSRPSTSSPLKVATLPKGKCRWDDSMPRNARKKADRQKNLPVQSQKNLPVQFPSIDSAIGTMATEERKKASMGLNLPVRRLSTDSIDEALMSDIFDDLSLPEDDDDSDELDSDEDAKDSTNSTDSTYLTDIM